MTIPYLYIKGLIGRRNEMPPAMPGQRYTYNPSHGQGFGEHALGQPLTAEMKELDLKPGMETAFFAYHAKDNWPIVSWADSTGISRQTTVDPITFTQDFHLLSKETE